MTIRTFTRGALAAALMGPLLAGLSGCDPQPAAGAAGTTLSITPSLGMVRNATVVVRNGAGTVVGNGSTSGNGRATVTATGNGPFIVEVQGDADATYFDEAAGSFLPFPAPRVIRALVPTGTTQVGVTGLTEVAHSLWAGNSVPLSNSNINAANNAVLAAFAPAGLTSLLTPPNPLSAIPANTLRTSPGDLYALLLGTLAQVGSGQSSPALATIEQLRRDVADGSIDGMEGSTAIPGVLYPAGIVTTFNTALASRVNAWGTPALQTATSTFTIDTLVEPTWTGGGSGGGGGGGDRPATINGALDGNYTVTFELANGVQQSQIPYYTDGQDYTISVDSGTGTLTVNGVPYTSPFHRSTTTSTAFPVWFSMAVNLEWELSNNDTGLFHEVTVYDPFPSSGTGIPAPLGQFSLSTGGGGGGGGTPVDCYDQRAAVFAAKAGTYTFTAGNVTGTLATRFTSGNTYSVTLDDQGFMTIQTNTGNVDLHDYYGLQDCATTPRILYWSENGLPAMTLTFDSSSSTDATMVVGSGSDAATLDGMPSTGGGGGGDPTDEAILALLNGRNGHLFNLSGSAHSWKLEDAQVERFSPSGMRTLEFGQQFFGSPQDTTPFNNTVPVYSEVEVTRSEGEQTCSSGNARVQVNLATTVASNPWHGTYESTDCVVRVLRMTERGAAEGIVVSATLSNGTQTLTLANSPFRVYMHPGSAGNATPITNDEFMTMNIVSSGAPEFTAGTHFRLDRPSGNVVGSSFAYGVDPEDGSASENSGEIKWIVQNAFFSGNGPFNCGTIYTASSRLNMRVWLGTYQAEKSFATPFTSGCTITIDSRSGNFYQASYTGTLTTSDTTIPTEELTIQVAGQFRNYMVREIRSNGDEGTLATDELGATLRVDNSSGHFRQDDRFKLPDRGPVYVSLASTALDFGFDREYAVDANVEVRMRNLPKATGQYLCGTAYNGSQSQNPEMRVETGQQMTYFTSFFQSGAYVLHPGANCTINVTEFSGTHIAGDYTATLVVPNGGDLVMPNGDNVITVSGTFREALEFETAP